MKADENIILERTDGNTDPFLVHLQLQTDSGLVNVPDAATVKMSVSDSDGDIEIAGAAQGGDSGIFAFPVNQLDAGAHTRKFDIDVDSGGVYATYGRGKIKTHAKIGT